MSTHIPRSETAVLNCSSIFIFYFLRNFQIETYNWCTNLHPSPAVANSFFSTSLSTCIIRFLSYFSPPRFEDLTHGLALARQVLYQWAKSLILSSDFLMIAILWWGGQGMLNLTPLTLIIGHCVSSVENYALPVFSPRSFSFHRSLIYFELTFVQGERYKPSFLLL